MKAGFEGGRSCELITSQIR